MDKPVDSGFRYFKHDSESRLGEGWTWLEFGHDGWPTRQVHRYGDRWFCSLEDYHPDIGPCLCDQPIDRLELFPDEEISAAEFEAAWQTALAHREKS